MNVDGKPFRTIWLAADGETVEIIDQTRLPFEFVVVRLATAAEAATAIRDMWVRGAPLIGATAAYGMALAMRDDPSDENLSIAADLLMATRPTAVNLRWAVDEMRKLLSPLSPNARSRA
ncbi:MAG: S-methyl-5-thioribose-1-phosphate isomerase, partial [Alphaproteobacteria bacterium]